jgi:hypothetical protein
MRLCSNNELEELVWRILSSCGSWTTLEDLDANDTDVSAIVVGFASFCWQIQDDWQMGV